MVNVSVNGMIYNIHRTKLNELLKWLEDNKISTVLDNTNPDQQGKTIING